MLAHTIVGDTPMSSEKDILRAMTASVGDVKGSGCNGERNEKKGPLYLQIKILFVIEYCMVYMRFIRIFLPNRS